jgi:hypothetical protein
MMNQIPKLHLFLQLLGGLSLTCAYTSQYVRQWRVPPKTSRKSLSVSLSSLASSTSSDNSKKIFVLNWDGCVANTVPWRIESGIHAAMKVWPDLPLLEDLRNHNDAWLRNKLSALSHVLLASSSGSSSSIGSDTTTPPLLASLSCEYALAARLLLEEQRLDGGESNGKSGKYASRFHPQQKQKQQQQEEKEEEVDSQQQSQRRRQTTKPQQRSNDNNNRSSRPLTVGEVAANWAEGGMIRDMVRLRYHCDYKDPLPILQQAIDSSLEYDMVEVRPTIESSVADALRLLLSIEENSVVVTIHHASELSMAAATLQEAKVKFQIFKTAEDALRHSTLESSTISLFCTNGSKTANRDLVAKAPHESTIYIVESSWHALQQDIALYGDYIPRQGNVGKCGVVPNRRLSLNLAGWAKTIDPTQQAAATMNPWTRVLSLSDFREMVCPAGFQ